MMEGFSLAWPDHYLAQGVYRLQYKCPRWALILQAINALRRIVVWLRETRKHCAKQGLRNRVILVLKSSHWYAVEQ